MSKDTKNKVVTANINENPVEVSPVDVEEVEETEEAVPMSLSSLEASLAAKEKEYAEKTASAVSNDARVKVPGLVTKMQDALVVKEAVLSDKDMVRIRGVRNITDTRALPKVNDWYWSDKVDNKLVEGGTYMVPRFVAKFVCACGLAIYLD